MAKLIFETGTGSFLDRQKLATRFEENLEAFLDDLGFAVVKYGHPIVIKNTWIASKLKKVASKASLAAIRVKFTPDYLIFRRDKPDDFFFCDAKVSSTPVFFGKQVDRIRNHYKDDPRLTSNDIAEVEREAWLSYNTFYPSDRVALILACPYNPKLLLAEWVSKIECMWCLKTAEEGNPGPWDCDQCPIFGKVKGGFDVLVNEFAGGSGTPHTNVHMSSMRTLDSFMSKEFGSNVDKELYQMWVDSVKGWPLNKPLGRVSWAQYNGAIKTLRKQCPWLKCRIKDEFIQCPGDEQQEIFKA